MKIEGALPCTVLILIALVLSNNGCLGSKYSIRLVYITAKNIYLAFFWNPKKDEDDVHDNLFAYYKQSIGTRKTLSIRT